METNATVARVLDLLFCASLIAIWVILLYHIFLTICGYKHFARTLADGDDDLQLDEYPTVSILIPAHNEAMVIGRTLDAMARLIYPRDKLQIVVVDDSSNDGTGKIIARKIAEHPDVSLEVVTLVNEAKGKANTLNKGLERLTGEYVVIYDADNTPERRAILHLVKGILKDKKLGAVVGKFRTRNKTTNLLTRFINIETLSFQWLLQAGRGYFMGMVTIPGTNYIIRRSILDDIGGWNVNSLTEDTEVTIRIYDDGYRIAWSPHAVTWEQEPETLRVWLKQRTRWAQGNMSVTWHYFWHIGSIGSWRMTVDLIYFFCLYFLFFVAIIVSDLIFILGLLGIYHVTIRGPFDIIWILAYILFIAETYVSISLERGEANRSNLFLSMLMYFTYSQLWIVLVFRATYATLKKFFAGDKQVRWYKTERSAR
jgi:cellulose synthase/poly-beta-1,6-N-acetylglucosamine synthase-like glycosyltransferase